MDTIRVTVDNAVATITLNRGKVNAINATMTDELDTAFDELAADDSVRSVVLTGEGSFFSFGFDVPELYPLPREQFTEFLATFNRFLRKLYLFPKPVIASINGHATAGGCLLTVACDYRIMADGKAKIGLNEVRIGAALFAGATAMLKSLCGQRNAEMIMLGGQLMSGSDARKLGLIDRTVDSDKVHETAKALADDWSTVSPAAFAGLKRLLREPVANQFDPLEADAIERFVDIWYSPETRELLKGVKIN